eukprot:3941613-Rhodomonas_salina.3
MARPPLSNSMGLDVIDPMSAPGSARHMRRTNSGMLPATDRSWLSDWLAHGRTVGVAWRQHQGG